VTYSGGIGGDASTNGGSTAAGGGGGVSGSPYGQGGRGGFAVSTNKSLVTATGGGGWVGNGGGNNYNGNFASNNSDPVGTGGGGIFDGSDGQASGGGGSHGQPNYAWSSSGNNWYMGQNASASGFGTGMRGGCGDYYGFIGAANTSGSGYNPAVAAQSRVDTESYFDIVNCTLKGSGGYGYAGYSSNSFHNAGSGGPGGGGGGIGAVTYKGTWDANANSPALTSSVGTQGDYYVVNVAGTTNLNGITDWQIGDWAIFNGSVWQKVDNTDAVTSVNGQVGTVVLTAANVNAVADTATITAGTGLTGGGNVASNVTITLANTAVSPDTYGGGTNAAQVTVDQQGRITAAANVAIPQGTVTNVATGTGLTGGPITSNGTISLANTAVTPATYGSANTAVTITVDQQGRLTNASNATIAISNSQVSGLGTMSTQNANNVAITGGTVSVSNITASNVSVTANLYANLATSNTAAMPDPSLPLNPEGYVTIIVNGAAKKIPYYGV